jgi:hypothetical protein
MYKDRVFWITGENASIGSWPAANLEVFNSVIGLAVDHVAAQTRTPPHYLIGKMANMAAEALTVAETGLVAKVVQRQTNFTRPQRELYRRIALAQGDKARADQARTGTIVWSDPQYRSLSQKIDAFQKWRSSGLPLRFLLEWYGLEPSEVDRVMKMAKDEATTLMRATPVPAPPGVVLPRGNAEIPIKAPPAPPAATRQPAHRSPLPRAKRGRRQPATGDTAMPENEELDDETATEEVDETLDSEEQDDTAGADQLGDAGKKSPRRHEGEVAGRTRQEPHPGPAIADAAKAKDAEGEKPDLDALRKQARDEARAESLRERALDKLEAKAARLFQDPEDARAFLAASWMTSSTATARRAGDQRRARRSTRETTVSRGHAT